MSKKNSLPLWADELANLKPGMRVILAHMGADPDPIPAGTAGTIRDIEPCVRDDEVQIFVKWDNGRSLSCVCPPDVLIPYPANVIVEAEKQTETHGGYHEFRWGAKYAQ